MTLQYLVKRRRRLAQKQAKVVSLGFLKDSIISQLQPLYGPEIIDIDLGAVSSHDTMELTIYLQKGRKSRTGKD